MEKAEQEGRKAWHMGIPASDNPYKIGSYNHKVWEEARKNEAYWMENTFNVCFGVKWTTSDME